MPVTCSRQGCSRLAIRAKRAGVTLLEVLVAILVTGVGLLALLNLFPLGALEMAQAIQDDRTAAIAANAIALSEAGEELLARTAKFVEFSWAQKSADPDVAAKLREEYEMLAVQAAVIDGQLRGLEKAFPKPVIQRFLPRLLAQLRLIKWRINTMIALFSMLEKGLQ